MNTYSALIIDDEIDSIQLIELYLKKYCREITTHYFANNIKDGIELFLVHKPNLLFLDIDLKNGENSFDLVNNYDLSQSEIIFITSHSEFAINVINNNENISGYILKPLKVADLLNAVTKSYKKMDVKNGKRNTPNKDNFNYIPIPSINKVDLIRPDEILYCAAEGKYTMFYTSDNRIITSSRNLGEYQDLLDPNVFFRIHHKYLVNTHLIKQLSKADGYFCELINGTSLPISKRRQESFNKFIKIKF